MIEIYKPLREKMILQNDINPISLFTLNIRIQKHFTILTLKFEQVHLTICSRCVCLKLLNVWQTEQTLIIRLFLWRPILVYTI